MVSRKLSDVTLKLVTSSRAAAQTMKPWFIFEPYETRDLCLKSEKYLAGKYSVSNLNMLTAKIRIQFHGQIFTHFIRRLFLRTSFQCWFQF